jgi:hypothetical protein
VNATAAAVQPLAGCPAGQSERRSLPRGRLWVVQFLSMMPWWCRCIPACCCMMQCSCYSVCNGCATEGNGESCVLWPNVEQQDIAATPHSCLGSATSTLQLLGCNYIAEAQALALAVLPPRQMTGAVAVTSTCPMANPRPTTSSGCTQKRGFSQHLHKGIEQQHTYATSVANSLTSLS